MEGYGTSPPPQSEESPQEKERRFAALVEDDAELEKFAAEVADAEIPAIPSSESRMEEKRPEEPEEDEEEEVAASPETKWLAQPSIRDQILRQPDSVRTVDPVTMVVDMSDQAAVKKFNEIEKAAADPEAPTMAILKQKEQAFEGKWTILLTYARVEYMKL